MSSSKTEEPVEESNQGSLSSNKACQSCSEEFGAIIRLGDMDADGEEGDADGYGGDSNSHDEDEDDNNDDEEEEGESREEDSSSGDESSGSSDSSSGTGSSDSVWKGPSCSFYSRIG